MAFVAAPHKDWADFVFEVIQLLLGEGFFLGYAGSCDTKKAAQSRQNVAESFTKGAHFDTLTR